MVSLWRETNVKATRKVALCAACLKRIAVGSEAWRFVGMSLDNDFCAGAMHPECRRAEVELNDLHEAAPDEWIQLHEFDPDDREWLLAEHPVAAARLGITNGASQ